MTKDGISDGLELGRCPAKRPSSTSPLGVSPWGSSCVRGRLYIDLQSPQRRTRPLVLLPAPTPSGARQIGERRADRRKGASGHRPLCPLPAPTQSGARRVEGTPDTEGPKDEKTCTRVAFSETLNLGTPAQTVVSSKGAGSFIGIFRWYFRWPGAGRGPAWGPSATSPVGIDRACEVGYIDLQRCPKMVFQKA